jgi:antitoxin component of MazEF toxin-antitoxin module
MPPRIAKWVRRRVERRIPKSVARRAQQKRLDDLIERITPENISEWIDWGPPVGREVW